MVSTKILACAILCAGLSGCATGYHSASDPIRGYAGGYREEPGPGELLKVAFYANGHSERDTVTAYLMYRCAELAQQRHKPYFRMYRSLADAVVNHPIDEAIIGRIGGDLGDWVFVLFDDSQVPGDLSTEATLKKYGSYVNKPEQHS